jgi:dienelactone hydrolase
VLVLAHGFAGSQQLMQPLGLSLARNGYIAITFDFPGHGRHVAPLPGGLADAQGRRRTLLDSLAAVVDFARGLPGSDGRLALLGHSMASDIVVRHAQANPSIVATVAVSLFAPSITADTPRDRPRNLLVVTGALEPQLLAREALRVTAPDAVADTTYGRFDDGTARRATRSPGVEHIGVLYSAHTQAEARAWLDAAFGRQAAAEAFVDRRGPWLALLLGGVLLLAWPLAQGLPRLAVPTPTGGERRRWWGWRGQAVITIVPALLTPLLLWPLPSGLMPILLADYLLAHFALYGLLTWLLLRWAGGGALPALRSDHRAALGLALLASSAYALLAFGWPIDRWLFNLWPPPQRLPLVAMLLAGTLPYFVADQLATRDDRAPRGAHLAAKAAFVLSLLLAIALNPPRLFFLAILVPALLLLFVVYGLLSLWLGRRTRHPLVPATALALVFAWFIGAVFPRVA